MAVKVDAVWTSVLDRRHCAILPRFDPTILCLWGARHNVRAAAGSEQHDQPHGLGWTYLRVHAGGSGGIGVGTGAMMGLPGMGAGGGQARQSP